MTPAPPKQIAIDQDDYHAEYIGKTVDGRQFFLACGSHLGCEFIAIYAFDKIGTLINATITGVGSRSQLDHDARIKLRDELLESLGEKSFKRIKISPFEFERFGVTFSLIPQQTDDGSAWRVTVEPGNYMCFWSPWTSGIYDT